MARKQENYDNEVVNLRAFYLRLLGKLWLLPAAAIVGAALFGGIYYLKNTVFASARNYVSESTLYIYFAYDENKGTQVDFYNAYTWNILIKTDEILDTIMENLEENGYPEDRVSRDRVIGDMNADIPSDVRVMLFTVTDTDPEICDAISGAATDAMVSYGISNDAFSQIKILRRTKASAEVLTDRTATAAVFGAAIGLAVMILFQLILESMNDAIYVPEMAERRYRQPVLGILTKSGQDEPSFFRNELLELTDTAFKGINRAAVLCVDDRTGSECAKEGKKRLTQVLGSAFDEKKIELLPLALPGNDAECVDELGRVQGALLLIKMGKRNSAMTEHLLSHLKKLGCPVLGLVITDADRRFLERYLGL